MSRLAPCAALLCACAACRDPQYLLHVELDQPPGADDRLELIAGGTLQELSLGAADLPASFGLVPGSADPLASFELRLRWLRGSSTVAVSARRVSGFPGAGVVDVWLCLASYCGRQPERCADPRLAPQGEIHPQQVGLLAVRLPSCAAAVEPPDAGPGLDADPGLDAQQLDAQPPDLGAPADAGAGEDARAPDAQAPPPPWVALLSGAELDLEDLIYDPATETSYLTGDVGGALSIETTSTASVVPTRGDRHSSFVLALDGRGRLRWLGQVTKAAGNPAISMDAVAEHQGQVFVAGEFGTGPLLDPAGALINGATGAFLLRRSAAGSWQSRVLGAGAAMDVLDLAIGPGGELLLAAHSGGGFADGSCILAGAAYFVAQLDPATLRCAALITTNSSPIHRLLSRGTAGALLLGSFEQDLNISGYQAQGVGPGGVDGFLAPLAGDTFQTPELFGSSGDDAPSDVALLADADSLAWSGSIELSPLHAGSATLSFAGTAVGAVRRQGSWAALSIPGAPDFTPLKVAPCGAELCLLGLLKADYPELMLTIDGDDALLLRFGLGALPGAELVSSSGNNKVYALATGPGRRVLAGSFSGPIRAGSASYGRAGLAGAYVLSVPEQ